MVSRLLLLPAALTTEGNAIGLLQSVRYQRITNCLVEGRCEARLLGLDEVEETRDVLRRRDPLHATIVELLEDHEGRTAHLLATEVLDARLTLLDGVDDHVIQSTTSGRHCNVVFVWDGTQTTKASL